MRTSVSAVALVGALLMASVTACSGEDDATPPRSAGSASTPSAEVTASEDAPAEPAARGPVADDCSLTTPRVRLVLRNWDRVVSSVGREDHADYARSLARQTTRLARRTASCPGADELRKVAAGARGLAREAQKPALPAYGEVARTGDRWLDALGYSTLSFSVG